MSAWETLMDRYLLKSQLEAHRNVRLYHHGYFVPPLCVSQFQWTNATRSLNPRNRFQKTEITLQIHGKSDILIPFHVVAVHIDGSGALSMLRFLFIHSARRELHTVNILRSWSLELTSTNLRIESSLVFVEISILRILSTWLKT
ncbi:hypothetical protein QCA50_012473 [Cerrena zonata]|uniref:Uncharacterized protein n=1 Tax=Cerrena zonata TaxID=2478898 RepID=A0AAW0G4B3_9APHY